MKHLLYIWTIISCPLIAGGQEIIHLENRREIFVDNYLFDKMDGVTIRMHAPHDEGPVFSFDKPWEGIYCAYFTIINDGETYRLYYRGMSRTAADARKGEEVTCYAESRDGINWVKPELGLFEVNGSTNNNITLAKAPRINHNFTPFLDVNPDAAPNERYKAIGGTQSGGLFAYSSPDGVRWTKMKEETVFNKGAFDSQNVVFWSESERCYLCYFRIWTGGKIDSGIRTVARSTSPDFINWTDPVAMTFGDAPMEDLYTNQTAPYFRAPHIYLAIGARFMPNRQILTEEQAKEFKVDGGYFKDCSDVFFMTSRGDNRYDRTFMEGFIRPGIGLNNWVSRTNYPALNVVRTGPYEMSVYVNQDYAQPTAHLRRYSLRLDGFTSLNAPYEGGEVLTKYLTFSGRSLEINYSTSAAGELRFELQDAKGKPIPGFTMENSDTVIGNEISRTVTWKGNADLQKLASKKVRLRIYMKDADLYSIRFKD